MTATAATYEVKRSTFWKIIAIVLVGIVGLGVLIHQLNANHHRPEGAAEDWLAAVGNTGREGVSEDAAKRAEEIGPVSLAAPLIPAEHDPKHSYFSDLEVGKAIDDGPGKVRVPFQLHQRVESGSAPLKKGTIVLTQSGDVWHVTAVDDRRPGEEVPSEGGAPPSEAPSGLWIAALVLGVLLTAVSAFVVHYADRTAREAMGTAT